MAGKPMSEQIRTSFKPGKQTHKMARRIVKQTDRHDTVKEFYEHAIAANVNRLYKLSAGGSEAHSLHMLLGEIRGISAHPIEDEAEARILNEEFREAPTTIDLRPSQIDNLGDAHDETGLSQSEIIRRCTFAQLHHLTHDSGVLEGWRKTEVQKTWDEVKAGLQRSKLNCYDVLQRRFVDEVEQTLRKIKDDPAGFDRFAYEYVHEFRGSDCYEQLQETRGKRTFTNIENAIEEFTDYEVSNEEARRSLDLRDLEVKS